MAGPHSPDVALIGPQARIGIIAGGGSLPLEIARSVQSRGGVVHVVMIEGQALGALRSFPHTDASWSEVGKAVKALKRAGTTDVVLVGKMTRPSLKTARPDFGFLRSLPSVIRIFKSGGDDAVLRAVISMFEGRGLKIRSAADVAPELLVNDGSLTQHQPSGADEIDIAKGLALIAALGRHDIGQATIISNGVIEAIEAAEGTDRMVARVATQRRDGKGAPVIHNRGVLVKRPKPGQDLRVDLPAIGPETVQQVADARLSGIAAMSGYVLAANRLELIRAAEREDVFVTGIPVDMIPMSAQSANAPFNAPMIFGGINPPSTAHADIHRAVGIMSTLAQFATGSAMVIRKGRVVSIGASEPPLDVIERGSGFFKVSRTRAGIAIIGPREALDEAIVDAAAVAGLAGVIVMFGREDRPQHRGAVVAKADALGLFLAGAVTTDVRRHDRAAVCERGFNTTAQNSADCWRTFRRCSWRQTHGGFTSGAARPRDVFGRWWRRDEPRRLGVAVPDGRRGGDGAARDFASVAAHCSPRLSDGRCCAGRKARRGCDY